YENNPAYFETYGCLYNWYTATSGNICPDGWHLPTFEEWEQLRNFIAGEGHQNQEGNALKTTTGWEGNGNGTNNYGFSALPGGSSMTSWDSAPFYRVVGYIGFWWSEIETSSTRARDLLLNNDRTDFDWHNDDKQRGFSVRCVRDQ
ncbi:MAG: hypothetical protein JXR70_16845, partial [Spirochaetales bacterium]|nr:hypothetical protein [Spirochaetales bacterium]